MEARPKLWISLGADSISIIDDVKAQHYMGEFPRL
jgi:hypothetical protein